MGKKAWKTEGKERIKGWGYSGRKMVLALLMAVLVAGVSGCGKGGNPASAEPEESWEPIPPGTYVPVASFREAVFDGFGDLSAEYSWQGDTVLYMETCWDSQAQERSRTIYRQSLDGRGEPEALVAETKEKRIDFFFADQEGNLYILGQEYGEETGQQAVEDTGDASRYYYSKLTGDGQQVFLTYPEGLPELQGPLFNVKGHADSEGNGYILDEFGGRVLFFDKEGNYCGEEAASLSGRHVVDAGPDGVYLWAQNWEAGCVELQKLDVEKGTVGEAQMLPVPDLVQSSNYTLLSGYEEGLLISSSDTLFRYDFSARQTEELLDWSDGNVNVDGYQVAGLRSLHRNERGELELEALLSSWATLESEIVQITYVDASTLPRRRTITLGGSEYTGYSLNKAIRRFNRENKEYQIRLVQFDEDDLMNALLYGKEEVPDLLDAGEVSVALLEHKGLLEDLEPYVADSQVVQKEDILEGIWEAGFAGGHLVRMVTAFHIESLVTTADTIQEPGFTPEELLALQEENPEARLLDYCYPLQVFSLVMAPQLERFVDWEKGKAFFDSDTFVDLLETVAGFRYPEDPSLGRNQKVFHEDEEIRKFLKGEYLVRWDYMGSYYDYQKRRDTYKDKARFIGYPAMDGQPCFELVPQREFCIYAASPRRDGAWAFIEYLLTETSQDWYGSEQGSFPVRKDSFAAYLEKPYDKYRNFIGEAQKEEYRGELLYMSEHLFRNGMDDRQIQMILYEEVEGFFAGDKTARETADIIQNRVQLYLDEQ